jgi:rhodanese-related sulfurtransferase
MLLCVSVGISCAKTQVSDNALITIGAAEAKEMMQSQDCLIVDVRTRQEYAEKHIPQAINIPLDEIGSTIPEKIFDANGPVLLYCRSGRRSHQAAEKLVSLGMETVYDFGGINDWPYDTVSSEDEAALSSPILMLDHHEQTETDGILFEVTGFADNMLYAEITNQSDAVYVYGEAFELRVKENGEWKQVPWADEPVWIEVAWELAPGESAQVKCAMTLVKTIDSGEYMLVKGGLETPFTLVYSE